MNDTVFQEGVPRRCTLFLEDGVPINSFQGRRRSTERHVPGRQSFRFEDLFFTTFCLWYGNFNDWGSKYFLVNMNRCSRLEFKKNSFLLLCFRSIHLSHVRVVNLFFQLFITKLIDLFQHLFVYVLNYISIRQSNDRLICLVTF